MAPRVAVSYAAILNFVGAFISLEVAATIASDVVDAGAITPQVIFAGLVGAITWNLITWFHGLPSSSSHALIANGNLAEGADPPAWVVVSAAAAIALGTYTGGWRIIRTMGMRIIRMDSAQGFSAQGAGAAVILASSHYGFPLSTTQVISGGVMGAGAGKRLSAVRWGVAGDIVTAWLLTLPMAAAIGAVAYAFVQLFGDGAVGPLIISVAGLALVVAFLARRSRQAAAPAAG